MTERESHRALILLGSNMDRKRNIPLALEKLANHSSLRLDATSSIYESAAVGGSGAQPLFSNGAALVETKLDPAALRQTLRSIEAALGRVRSADKYAPRPIDLDIVLFDNFVGEVEGSPIPDPDLLRFAHVAAPCAEIAPEWMHPTSAETLQIISARIGSAGLCRT
ncbi:MAG: 2-amino-4-hydroxy-6-hydroxymethyldihydropteridine diphosphokinase [Chloroflexi bacterium]|nr:2-amino-4-hydroxy-6-hydroxymethyldihydropteridine diphosphokinase [Chloroflexota bacterium]